MSKKTRKAKGSPVRTAVNKGSGVRTQIYTSARGVQAEFSPMPPMLVARMETQIDAEFGVIEPPTYTVETIGGGSTTLVHTQETIETDEQQAEWDAYIARKAARDEKQQSMMLRALQLECLRPIIDEDDDWMDRLEFVGITVPDNKYDRHLLWVESQFIGHPDDIIACLTIPMQLAGVAQGDMAAAESMFRDTV